MLPLDQHYQYHPLYSKLDNILIFILLLLGWNYEWNYVIYANWPPIILDYLIAITPAVYIALYFLSQRKVSPVTPNYSIYLRPYTTLLIIFSIIVLFERTGNGFQNTVLFWKSYYFFLLIPIWGYIGFEIGGNIERSHKFIREISRLGGIAIISSFVLRLLGFGLNSPYGPMDWPYRFICIFGFFYFLSVQITGIQKKPSTKYWLIICSVAVFSGIYKFTIVSTVLGLIGWSIFLLNKNHEIRMKRIILNSSVIFVSIIALFVVDMVTGGSISATIIDVVQKRWLKNIEDFDLRGVNDLTGSRLVMWTLMIPQIRNNLFFGSGLGQKYQGDIVSHNGYIDIVLSYGIIGLIIFLIGLYVWFRYISKLKTTGVPFLICLASIGFICTIIISNLFGSMWIQFHTINAYVMIIGGISYRISRESK